MTTTTPAQVAEIYDTIAEEYDSRYADDTCHFENGVVAALVKGLTYLENPRLLDIGCGAGLALELELTIVENYIGIDPSHGMINRFNRKFPEAIGSVSVTTFEEWCQNVWDEQYPAGEHPQFDLAISLFGSPSYIDPAYMQRVLELAPAVMMMHYKPGYWPDYEPEPINSPGSREAAKNAVLAAGGRVITFNNFWVTLLGGES